MKSILSLLFALLIVLLFGGLAFFFLNISSGAKLERIEKKATPPASELPT